MLTGQPAFKWSDVVDLTMLVITGGKERTLDDYTRLFAACGFAYQETIDLPSGFSLLIADKV